MHFEQSIVARLRRSPDSIAASSHPPPHSPHPRLARHSSISSYSSSAASRTSPRLDLCAGYFSGVPEHNIAAMAVSHQEEVERQSAPVTPSVRRRNDSRRYLLTTSAQGELVHWAWSHCGYEARALLLPPTTSACSNTSTASNGHRRTHWIPNVAGSSLVNRERLDTPRLNAVTAIRSCRVANKSVFVTSDTAGCISQWSIDGDCCYCSTRLCPFAITQMIIFTSSTPHVESSASPTYAVCASKESTLVYIIDLLEMCVVRIIDVVLESDAHTHDIDDGPTDSAVLGVASMSLRHVVHEDTSMIPSRVDSTQLIVASTRAHISVWDLTSIIVSTLQLSADPSSDASSIGSPLMRNRSRSISQAVSFLASLPPVDCDQSTCLYASIERFDFLVDPVVSSTVYSHPLLPSYSSSPSISSAYLLLVMTRHWIVIDIDTWQPIIPLQSLAEKHRLDISRTDASHLLTPQCLLRGGTFITETPSPHLNSNSISVMLWSSCGMVWINSLDPPSSLSSSSRTVAVTVDSPPLHSTLTVMKLAPFMNLDVASLPSYCVCSIASNRVLIGYQGQLLEYRLLSDALDVDDGASLQATLIAPTFSSHFTNAFATPAFLQQQLSSSSSSIALSSTAAPSSPSPSSSSIPSLRPSPIATCTTMLFDVISRPSSGLSSLLILLMKGYASGRIEFYRVVTSAPACSAQSVSPDAHSEADSFLFIEAHTASVTSLLAIQAHESIFTVPLVVSSSLDCSVAVWDARSSTLVFRLDTPSAVVDLSRPVLPPTVQTRSTDDAPPLHLHTNIKCIDLELVCAICADFSVRIFSISRMNWIQILRGHDSVPKSVYRDEWALISDFLFVLTQRNSIYVWCISSGQLEEVMTGYTLNHSIELLQQFPIYGNGGAMRVVTDSPLRRVARSISVALSLTPPAHTRSSSSNTDLTPLPLISESTSENLLSPTRAITPRSRSPRASHSTSRLSSSNHHLLTPSHHRQESTPSRLRTPPPLSPSMPLPRSLASIPGMKTASWAVHYGLQRLWKLGGKGGLANIDNVQASTMNLGAALTPIVPTSNLICSFESLPALHLNFFSLDLGFLTDEIRCAYAPLDATSGANQSQSHAEIGLETKHRAEVYKEILKLLLDWRELSNNSSSSAVDSSVLDIAFTQFHMYSPHCSRREGTHKPYSIAPMYACYSPTNNAVTVLLPRTCMSLSQSDTVSPLTKTTSLTHLSRWSIGPFFSASHALCLTTVLLSLLGSSDIHLHNYYSLLEAFYNATLPTLQDSSATSSWSYIESDITFLSSYALHEHEDIRRGSRLLIQGIIGRMPLDELWNAMREWSAFYDTMVTPPPLPWTDAVSAGSTDSPSYSPPPRYVSDFEFMTCMILCHLYQAQSRKPQNSVDASPEANNVDANNTEMDAQSDLNILHALSAINASTIGGRVSPDNHSPASVISLDASALGISGLKVESSPPNSFSKQVDLDDSKQDAENVRAVTSTHRAPGEKIPWIISTLLRLLSQTHQDSSLHSIQKSSICVELLIQGLAQPTRTAMSPQSAAGANRFWQCIPTAALEPLYRIIFDLSFVSPELAASAAVIDPSSSPPPPTHPSITLSNNCRVLLYELVKWNIPHFIEWTRKEIFGYEGVSGGDFFGQLELPTSAASTKLLPGHGSTASISSAAPPTSFSLSSCSSFKSAHFDEYRYQLISVLVSLPKKYATRMNYGVLKCMIDVVLRVLDPLLPAQTSYSSGSAITPTSSLAGGASRQSTAIGGGFLPLRDRFFTLLHPWFLFLSSKYTWLSYNASSHKLAVAENLRWIYYERSALGFYTGVARPNSTPKSNDSFSSKPHDEQHYLTTTAPVIHIYDVQTSHRWRTLEGHAAGSEIDCITFSPNGHLLASYCSSDTPTPSVRVWSTDYESSSVGSNFLPARFFMQTVLKLNPFCTRVIELPHITPPLTTQRMIEKRNASMLDMYGVISIATLQWKNNETMILAREDGRTSTLSAT